MAFFCFRPYYIFFVHKSKFTFMSQGKPLSGNIQRQSRHQSFAMPSSPECDTRVTQVFSADIKTRYRRPLYQHSVTAGFPSPAEDHIDSRLDLNRHFVRNPAATFYVRVDGDSMIGAGIHSGDLLIVDRSLEPSPGKVVIAVINGEHTVKRLRREGNLIVLMAENPDYAPIIVSELQELHIWGVVTEVIHSL
jgi:DNA polymerase V